MKDFYRLVWTWLKVSGGVGGLCDYRVSSLALAKSLTIELNEDLTIPTIQATTTNTFIIDALNINVKIWDLWTSTNQLFYVSTRIY